MEGIHFFALKELSHIAIHCWKALLLSIWRHPFYKFLLKGLPAIYAQNYQHFQHISFEVICESEKLLCPLHISSKEFVCTSVLCAIILYIITSKKFVRIVCHLPLHISLELIMCGRLAPFLRANISCEVLGLVVLPPAPANTVPP